MHAAALVEVAEGRRGGGDERRGAFGGERADRVERVHADELGGEGDDTVVTLLTRDQVDDAGVGCGPQHLGLVHEAPDEVRLGGALHRQGAAARRDRSDDP